MLSGRSYLKSTVWLVSHKRRSLQIQHCSTTLNFKGEKTKHMHTFRVLWCFVLSVLLPSSVIQVMICRTLHSTHPAVKWPSSCCWSAPQLPVSDCVCGWICWSCGPTAAASVCWIWRLCGALSATWWPQGSYSEKKKKLEDEFVLKIWWCIKIPLTGVSSPASTRCQPYAASCWTCSHWPTCQHQQLLHVNRLPPYFLGLAASLWSYPGRNIWNKDDIFHTLRNLTIKMIQMIMNICIAVLKNEINCILLTLTWWCHPIGSLDLL